jgi:hypothetical protein
MDTYVDTLSSTNTISVSSEPIDSDQLAYNEELARINSTLQHVLSTLDVAECTMRESLTALPLCPYERMRYQYVHSKGLEPFSLDDIQLDIDNLPDHVQLMEDVSRVAEKYDIVCNTHIQHLSALGHMEDIHPHIGNVFANIKEDGSIELDEQKMGDHIRFLDMINNITVEQIEANPLEMVHKILNKYINTY